MPYFHIRTNRAVEEASKEALYQELGRIIELIPGKSAGWVMTGLDAEADLCFAQDSSQPAAMVLLKSMGGLESRQYDLLTEELCAAVHRLLDIPPDRIYVTYESIAHWGWNGKNF